MDESTRKIRRAIEQRGGYLHAIWTQLHSEKVPDVKGILSRAIAKWGKENAAKVPPPKTPGEFVARMASGNPEGVYDRTVLESSDSLGLVSLGHCPLVNAWIERGASKDEVQALCDIACEGDYTAVGEYLNLQFDKRIGAGDDRCIMRITPKSDKGDGSNG